MPFIDEPLIANLKEISTYAGISSLLSWDQETQLPSGSIDGRSEQLALLSKRIHECHTSPEFEKNLSQLVDVSNGEVKAGFNERETHAINVIYKDWKQSIALPSDFLEKLTRLISQAQHHWQIARKENDFSIFAPYLSDLVEMTKEKATYLNDGQSPYDTLLDLYEPGMTEAELTPIFTRLRDELATLIKNISQSNKAKSSVHLSKHPINNDKQMALNEFLLKTIGFDLNRGRIDVSTHPFTIDFHTSDVRITTRMDARNVLENFTSTMHEAGHGLYEQGFDDQWFGTPFAEAASLGIHESQSRLWENYVGRSREFWTWFYPKLSKFFPSEFEGNIDDFYAAANQVNPSLIRVEADEVTYNLHILIRYDIERKLFLENCKVTDLPEIWNESYKRYLGLTPPNDSQGVLQDVHWSTGGFGYFPTYTLGNLYGRQLFDAALNQIPKLKKQISSGHFQELNRWLKQNVYQLARTMSPKDIVEKATQNVFSEVPFVDYLKEKYGELYL